MVRLRNVEPGDLDVYVRMRCDPVMMAELGGPLPREGIEAKVLKDVEDAASGLSWILMILPDDAGIVAGSVQLWSNAHAEPISEIGWMVLPEFQGRGLAKSAARALLERARAMDRWGVVHAFPSVTKCAIQRHLPLAGVHADGRGVVYVLWPAAAHQPLADRPTNRPVSRSRCDPGPAALLRPGGQPDRSSAAPDMDAVKSHRRSQLHRTL